MSPRDNKRKENIIIIKDLTKIGNLRSRGLVKSKVNLSLNRINCKLTQFCKYKCFICIQLNRW
jgi:hypothetical protein